MWMTRRASLMHFISLTFLLGGYSIKLYSLFFFNHEQGEWLFYKVKVEQSEELFYKVKVEQSEELFYKVKVEQGEWLFRKKGIKKSLFYSPI